MKGVRRRVYNTAGHTFVAIGAVGAVTPILPTVPFLLLAFLCYVRGNKWFLRKLLKHPRHGPAIRNWMRHGVISSKAKTLATLVICLSAGFSFLIIPIAFVRYGVLAILACVVLFILTRPGEPRKRE